MEAAAVWLLHPLADISGCEALGISATSSLYGTIGHTYAETTSTSTSTHHQFSLQLRTVADYLRVFTTTTLTDSFALCPLPPFVRGIDIESGFHDDQGNNRGSSRLRITHPSYHYIRTSAPSVKSNRFILTSALGTTYSATARSRLFKLPLCCYFGMLSHDGHRDDHGSGDAKDNGNKISEKGNDKCDEMADKKAGLNLGVDEKNPNLCSTCRKVDFNSLFSSHDCTVNKKAGGTINYRFETHDPTCRCGQEIMTHSCQLTSSRLKHTDLLGKLDCHAPACSFCAFLYQCHVRLNLISTKQEQWRCKIKPRYSLPNIVGWPMSDSVQDIAVLRMHKVQKTESRRELRVWTIPQPILRMVDSGGKTLTRNRCAGGGLLGRKLDPNKVDLNLIGEWLTLCRSTHSSCEDVDAGRIPGLLVIDCITDHVVPLPLKQDAANQVENYVTLSYLWGKAEATGGSVVQSINCDGGSGLALPTQIPLVISDAIRVVKQLGYRYLWVDRYCIPQEDGAAKHIQILNMGRIYSNSILTIIAAAGDGPDYGLPGVSSRPRLAQVGVKINDEISLVLYEPPKDHIASSKWNTRGWTYQEGLLSKRRLVFTDLMVYFQCHEMHGDEVLSLPIPGLGEDRDEVRPLELKNIDLGMVFPRVTDWDDPMTAWKRISEYGPRELGYDSDALNAISGVMETYALAAGKSGFKSFCGLPIFSVRLWADSWGRSYHCETPRMLSFRTWFENAERYKGSCNARTIEEKNLTCSLAYSLCWRHDWGESYKLPASFEQARRKVFGSWTTAGWRTRKFEADKINLLDSDLRISVQYSGELLLNWENDNPRIFDLSRNGKLPLSLNVTGLVMDVQMIWQIHRYFGTEAWITTSRFRSKASLFRFPRWFFEEASSGSKLLFLILGCRYQPYWRENPNFWGLILKPVTKLSDGEARTFYEKLDSCEMVVSEDDWPQLASLTREMEVRLI